LAIHPRSRPEPVAGATPLPANSIVAMRIVVIGGTGHIGTFLVPQLVALGHEVTVLSRGRRKPYQSPGSWTRVDMVEVDRQAEDERGSFGELVAGLGPDVVIDLICFTEDSAGQLAEALEGRVQHLLHCGSIWVHGPSASVPTREDAPRRPLGSTEPARPLSSVTCWGAPARGECRRR